MDNQSTILNCTHLVVGLMIAVILVCKPAGAGEVGMTSPVTQNGFYASSHLSKNDSLDASPSNGTKLTIPLTGSVSLDLSLTSIDTRQALTGVEPSNVPLIPVTKPGDFDFRSYRLGAGFSFKF